MANEFNVEPVDYQDVPGLVDTMMRAMYLDEHYKILYKKAPIQELIDDTKKRMSFNLASHRECNRHEKVIHVETGTIVGYARWVLPQSVTSDVPWSEAQTRQPTEEEKDIFQQDFNSTMENGRRKVLNHEINRGPLGAEKGDCFDELVKDKDCMELEYMVTAPEYQRRGIASMLLERGMEQAQKLHLDVVIMSTAAGIPFYVARGFRLSRKISQDFSKWGTTNPRVIGFLIKEVQSRKPNYDV